MHSLSDNLKYFLVSMSCRLIDHTQTEYFLGYTLGNLYFVGIFLQILKECFYLQHESWSIGLKVIITANSGKNLIANTEWCVHRRYIWSNLGHYLQQGNLSEVGWFTTLRRENKITNMIQLTSFLTGKMSKIKTKAPNPIYAFYTIISNFF